MKVVSDCRCRVCGTDEWYRVRAGTGHRYICVSCQRRRMRARTADGRNRIDARNYRDRGRFAVPAGWVRLCCACHRGQAMPVEDYLAVHA